MRDAQRTVNGDTDEITKLFELATSQTEGSEIPEDKVVIGTRRLELVPTRDELRTKGPCVSNDLLGVCFPCWLASLEEGSSDTGNGLREKVTSTDSFRKMNFNIDIRCCGDRPGKQGRQRR